MLRRFLLAHLISSAFAIVGVAQEPAQIVPFTAPFGGLNILQHPTAIGDKELTKFSNGMLNGQGEMYKRGALSTLYSNSVIFGGANPGFNSLMRFIKTQGKIMNNMDRVLIGSIPGISLNGNTYYTWYSDTTTFGWRKKYSGAPDSLSQLDYRTGTVYCTTGVSKIRGTGTTWTLNIPNGSYIFAGSAGATAAGDIYVANDTLIFEGSSLDGDATASAQAYEVWPQSINIDNPEAVAYRDSVYIPRGVFDPPGWADDQMFKVNVLENGYARLLADSSLVDSSKAWIPNQWVGQWIQWRKRAVTTGNGETVCDLTDCTWNTNYMPIIGNTNNKLISNYSVQTADSTYVIVSFPIDEPLVPTVVVNNVDAGNNIIGLNPKPTQLGSQEYLHIVSSPINVVGISGRGAGFISQTNYVNDTSGGNFHLHQVESFPYTATGNSVIKLLRSRFPVARFVRIFKDRALWISDSVYQNSMWWSQPGKPGYVVPNDFLAINPADGEVLNAVWTTEDAVYLAKESKCYALVGNDPSVWQIVQISDKIGVSAPRSVVQRGGRTWFYDWPNGFYEFSGNGFKLISDKIRPLIDSINTSKIQKVCGAYYATSAGDFILWAFPNGSSTANDRLICYHPATETWSQWDITQAGSYGIKINSMLVQDGRGDKGELLLAVEDSAYVLRYNPAAFTDSFVGLNGGNKTNTVSMIAESKRFELPPERLRAKDFQVNFTSDGVSASGFSLNFYKGFSSTSLQQITLPDSNGNFSYKKSLSDAIVGNQLAWRLTTVAARNFRLAGLYLTLSPWGKRLPE